MKTESEQKERNWEKMVLEKEAEAGPAKELGFSLRSLDSFKG